MSHFIFSQITKRGGRPVNTDNLPSIGGEWSFFEDADGAIIHLEKSRFHEVQRFLTHLLGKPAQIPTETTNGGELGWYATREIGAYVQFGYDETKAYLNITRPITPEEAIESLGRIAEEE